MLNARQIVIPPMVSLNEICGHRAGSKFPPVWIESLKKISTANDLHASFNSSYLFFGLFQHQHHFYRSYFYIKLQRLYYFFLSTKCGPALIPCQRHQRSSQDPGGVWVGRCLSFADQPWAQTWLNAAPNFSAIVIGTGPTITLVIWKYNGSDSCNGIYVCFR